MVLKRIFEKQSQGFYVDVGAHHPQRFSNTYHFYLKGWRGINIDAMPGSMEIFNRLRPDDVNLEIPVSNTDSILTYNMFNEPALNSFDEIVVSQHDGFGDYKVVERRQIETRKLRDILTEHLPHSTSIDFLSIDVEGLDYEVLLSNDWAKYRPRVVLIEDLARSALSETSESPIANFMLETGYEPFCKTVSTLFFHLKN